MDRRVYASVAVLLALILKQGVDERRARKLRALLDPEIDIDQRTLANWRKWWALEFPKSGLWTELRGRLDRPCDVALLPWSLFDRIDAEDDEQRLIRLLQMLEPLSVSALMRRRLARAA